MQVNSLLIMLKESKPLLSLAFSRVNYLVNPAKFAKLFLANLAKNIFHYKSYISICYE